MRRLVAFVSIAIVTAAWLSWPAPGQALVHATISVTSSPNPSVTSTTIKIVIKFAAPVTDIRFWLQRQGGYQGPAECTPACNFFSLDGSPTWVLASASGTVTATFLTDARPGATDAVYHDGFSAEFVALREKNPTVTTSLTRTPTGAVMPGDTLHVSVKTATDAGPMHDDLWVVLPSGVSAPTNLPSGVVYEGWHAVHRLVTVDLAATYAVDVVIEAPVGTKLVFTGYLSQPGGWNRGGTMTVTVGVAPTPRPTAKPKATKSPHPSPGATVRASDPGSPLPSPSNASVSPSPSPSPTGAVSPSAATASSTLMPTPKSTAGPDVALTGGAMEGGFAVGLVVVLAVGLGCLIVLRRTRQGRVPTLGP